jgi:hypothetical protein
VRRFTVEWAIIEMVQAQYFVCEDAETLQVQIRRRGDVDIESSIGIKTKGMSAKEGLDYHTPPDDIIHFNPGEKLSPAELRIMWEGFDDAWKWVISGALATRMC